MHVATVRSGSRQRLEKRWVVPLLIAILCLGFISIVASADWVECVQARLDGKNAVHLLVKADEKGTVKFTIGQNVIHFSVSANVPLDTGRLRLDKNVETVIVELSDAKGVLTERCTIPVKEITAQYKNFCCDREGPDVRIEIDPAPGLGGWIRTAVTLRITAEDNSGVAEIFCQSPVISDGDIVRIGLDRLELSDGGRTAETRRELYPQYTPSGCHEVECWATDTAGSVSDRVGVELQLDFDAPRIDMDVTSSGDAATVRWEVSDQFSGVRVCRVTLVTSGVEHVLSTSLSGERTLAADEFGAGSHEVHIWACDQAGNEFRAMRSAALTARTCSIAGQVVDSRTSQPIPGVTVLIHQTGLTRTTDNYGRYTFSNLPADCMYTLYFGKEGEYQTLGVSILSCASGATEDLSVRLSPQTGKPIAISWDPNLFGTCADIDAERNATVQLHLRAVSDSQWYLVFDLGRNAQEPRAWFLGIHLKLSEQIKTFDSGKSDGNVLVIEIPVSMFSDNLVRFQAFAMIDGAVEMSEVLTLRILD